MIARTETPLDYALLIGQGRSGTNFLLSLLDQSPLAHCRNEPDQCAGSALARLAEFRFFVDHEERLARLYDEALREAARCVGPRDHMARVEKVWLRRGARRPGYFYLRQRFRAVERWLRDRAPMDGRELRYPPWMAHRERLARSFHVFKLNAAVGLGSWALRQRPGTRVLHIVRHPGGFARSWLKRWAQGEGGRERSPQSSDRLRELGRRAPAWAVLLGDVDALERAEGELWWWRYVNETLHEAGRGQAGYRLVLYEELAARPLDVTRQVYGSCGLTWDDTIAARVGSIASGADTIARAWKDELEPSLVQLVERVLDGSSIATWWRAAEAA